MLVRIVALSLGLLILGAISNPAPAQALGTGFTVTYKSPPAPKLRFPILLDADGEAFQAWNVRGLPKTFVVDKQGRLVYEAEGGRDMNSDHIRKLLQELIDE